MATHFALASALGQQAPFWDRSLDLVVMTDPDTGLITGLAKVLDRYRVDGWLDNGRPDEDAVFLSERSRRSDRALGGAGTQDTYACLLS